MLALLFLFAAATVCGTPQPRRRPPAMAPQRTSTTSTTTTLASSTLTITAVSTALRPLPPNPDLFAGLPEEEQPSSEDSPGRPANKPFVVQPVKFIQSRPFGWSSDTDEDDFFAGILFSESEAEPEVDGQISKADL